MSISQYFNYKIKQGKTHERPFIKKMFGPVSVSS